jgi:hypothetical protein
MDDIDFVFINKSLSEKEDQEFKDFLINKKTKKAHSANKKKPAINPTK